MGEITAQMDKQIIPERRNGTLIEHVMQTIRARIAGRSLAPGAKLPSIRQLAATLQVSKSTIVEAYDRLMAEGIIHSRKASGFYVAGHLPPLSLNNVGLRLDRAVDPVWMSRQALEIGDGLLKPGCGWLPPAWMPEEALRRALRSVSRAESGSMTDYDIPLGLLPLRQYLSRRMIEFGIEAAPDQIMLTESGTQALDLLCRLLLEPGATVLVDDPCYFNFLAMLRAHRANIVSVSFTPAGPDLDAFAQALATHQPRLYITNSSLQNPTGATLSPAVAHRLLKLADQSDLIIIEDNIYADLDPEPAPRLAGFDGLERVIQIGSFSKTLSSAGRCGYIMARQDWMENLTDLKLATSFGGGRLAAELVLTVLKDGTYRKHVHNLRERLARAMVETSRRLRAIGLTPWIEPRAGMFLWCALPAGLDAAEIAKRALVEGVVLAPGNVFSQARNAGNFLRFNAAQCADPRIYSVLEAVMHNTKSELT